jgi:hypothetical protein
MTERHGYGYGEQPSGERPSGRGAVAERRARHDEEVREVDLTDEAGETGEAGEAGGREGPRSDREAAGAFEADPAVAPPGARPTAASTSIFDVGGDDPSAAATRTGPTDPAAQEPAAPEPATAEAAAEAAGSEPDGAPIAATGATAGPPAALLASLDTEGVRSRFLDIQAGFVDEPRQAVEEAGRFVEELVQQVIDGLQAQRGQLKAPADETSTEDLRLALRDYRQFVDRLLGLAL